MRKLISQIHLWLGLVSGLVVFVVSITGAIYVFQKEINHLIHPNYYYINKIPESAKMLPFEELRKKAEHALQVPSTYAYAYTDGKQNWSFLARKKGNSNALWIFDAYEYFKIAYINPYTGKVVAVVDMHKDFFNIIKYLHWSLLLNTPYGQPIVAWGTVIFVVLMITGLILWWPKWKKKKSRNQAFKINFKRKWKRLNFELHNVLGFYVALLSILLAVTGLVYSFTAVKNGLYTIANGSSEKQEKIVKKSSDSTVNLEYPKQVALENAKELVPEAIRFSISLYPPKMKDTPIYISAYHNENLYYNKTDFQFDAFSGRKLYSSDFTNKNRGEKLIAMNYDIHVGSIGGITGKIIAFITCIICASLPITGFLYWWYRKKFFS